jgi:hypothetical protein
MHVNIAAALLAAFSFYGLGRADTSLSAVQEAAAAISPWIIDVRRELHQIPELLYNETATSAALRRHLDALRIPYKRASLLSSRTCSGP